MNMEQLLKNILTAEEIQSGTLSTGGASGTVPSGHLQRQGSLTLPRTVNQKTVDEVWKEVVKANIAEKNENGNGSSFVRREPSLSEMTLEEFLVKAGIVREDFQPSENTNNAGFYAGSFGLSLGFQQSNDRNNIVFDTSIVVNVRSGQQQSQQPQLPNQANLAFSTPSPQTKMLIHSESETRNASPSAYHFGENGIRSTASVEKVVERRKKRMIKNRESAARSRARKQTYTLELEAEIANLKYVNQKLRKKQEEIMEMHKNEIKETMNKPGVHKGSVLRRTLTGPW